jgi:hypothetical protein
MLLVEVGPPNSLISHLDRRAATGVLTYILSLIHTKKDPVTAVSMVVQPKERDNGSGAVKHYISSQAQPVFDDGDGEVFPGRGTRLE